jgi:hypothetical protein
MLLGSLGLLMSRYLLAEFQDLPLRLLELMPGR